MPRRTVLVALLAFLAMPAAADSLELSFPEFSGEFSYDDPALLGSFDLGGPFASLEQVTVAITGSGAAGLIEICQVIPPGSCNQGEIEAELVVWFRREEGFFPFGVIGPFDSESRTLEIVFDGSNPLHPLDPLLDGEGELGIVINGVATIPENSLEILVPSQVDITEVTVTFEGTLVPEPSAIYQWITALGAIALSGRSSATRRARGTRWAAPTPRLTHPADLAIHSGRTPARARPSM